MVASDTGGAASFIGTRVQAPGERAIEIDQHAQRLLASGKNDARSWLSQPGEKRVVWKWNKASALEAINDLHRAGAREIWVASVRQLDRGGEMAWNFVVALPSEVGARKRVFAWIERWERDASIDANNLTTDVGQTYFVIDTDQ